MNTRTRWPWVALLLCLAGCGSEPAALPPAAAAPVEPARIALGVKGRSSDAPSVAAWGQMVAVTWTASIDATSDIYLAVSSDDGATFGAPVRVNDVEGDAHASAEQPARVVIDARKAIHVVWPSSRLGRSVIRYATSGDGGRSFSPAVSVAGEGLSGARGWSSLALGYDGGMHVVWLDGRNDAPMHKGHGMPASRSLRSQGPRQDIFHATWKGDGARSERAIAGNVCFCCKTAVATAGDRVYAAWRHIYPGSVRDIAMARSTDNGLTFGEPLRVSEDGWKIEACPDDGPAMTADGHGGIHIAWPTLVAGDRPRKGIFYASLVNEQAFTPRLRLDSGESDPAHPQIAADQHTDTTVVWDERAGDTKRIVLRRVSNGTAGSPQTFEGKGVGYPVIAAGETHWVILWSAHGADGSKIIEGRILAHGPADSRP